MIEPEVLASFGPFFGVTTHTRTPGPPWRPMSELVTDPARLAARVAQVRDALAAAAGTDEIEIRVAASVAHLGLTARLVAPVLGLAVLGDPDPVIELTEVYWQPELGGPFPLSLPASIARSDDTPPRIPLSAFLEGAVLALVDNMLGAVSLTPHVLWGNVASAIHSAGQMMGNVRSEFRERAVGIAEEVLAHPLLRAEHQQFGGRFQRRSCCLIYRISGPGSVSSRSVCGDCVLAT